MNSILKQLYYGQIRPFEVAVPRSESYRELLHTLSDAEQQFCRSLSAHQSTEYEHLSQLRQKLLSEEAEETFSIGFLLAYQLLTEVRHR